MAPNRSLLSAARAFINRSARTSAVVIAPLAAVAVAHTAQAQVTFGVPSNSSGGFGPEGFSQSGFSASALPSFNGITGVIQAQSGSFLTSGGTVSGGVGILFFGSQLVTGTLNTSTVIPVAFDFNLSPDGSISNIHWVVSLNIGGSNQIIATGSAIGEISGSGVYTVGSDVTNPFYEPQFQVTYDSSASASSFGVDMTGPGQGVAINPVPEPSTYALIFGAGALGFVYFRRQRRNATA